MRSFSVLPSDEIQCLIQFLVFESLILCIGYNWFYRIGFCVEPTDALNLWVEWKLNTFWAPVEPEWEIWWNRNYIDYFAKFVVRHTCMVQNGMQIWYIYNLNTSNSYVERFIGLRINQTRIVIANQRDAWNHWITVESRRTHYIIFDIKTQKIVQIINYIILMLKRKVHLPQLERNARCQLIKLEQMQTAIYSAPWCTYTIFFIYIFLTRKQPNQKILLADLVTFNEVTVDISLETNYLLSVQPLERYWT